jgi:hypothetical protein
MSSLPRRACVLLYESVMRRLLVPVSPVRQDSGHEPPPATRSYKLCHSSTAMSYTRAGHGLRLAFRAPHAC